MREIRLVLIGLLVNLFYTETVFACAFRKLVDEALAKKAISASRLVTKDIINDPVPPPWSSDPAVRKVQIEAWEREILTEAEKRWTSQGVQYERIRYKDGEALRVLPKGNANLNLLRFRVGEWVDSSAYPFQIVFSPRALVREWPEKNSHYLVKGSYAGGTNTIHLSFENIEKIELNGTFHHEFLHAAFDYLRAQGKNSAFHGQFFSRDGKSSLWKGVNYTDYMNLEELATFPINLRLDASKLQAIMNEINPTRKQFEASRFIKSVFGHSLTNAVNARHAAISLNHILLHQDRGHFPTLLKAAFYIRGNTSVRPSLTAEFEWANIKYRMKLPEEGFKDLLSDLANQTEFNVFQMNKPIQEKIIQRLMTQIKVQYEMASKASKTADALVLRLDHYREKQKREMLTHEELEELKECLLKTREVTLPYITISGGVSPRKSKVY